MVRPKLLFVLQYELSQFTHELERLNKGLKVLFKENHKCGNERERSPFSFLCIAPSWIMLAKKVAHSYVVVSNY